MREKKNQIFQGLVGNGSEEKVVKGHPANVCEQLE